MCAILLHFVSQPPGYFSSHFPATELRRWFKKNNQRPKTFSQNAPNARICKTCSVATDRKPLRSLQKQQRHPAIGFRRTNGKRALEGSVARKGSEVACRGGGNGNPGCRPRSTEEQEWIKKKKTKCVSERVSMCERCVCPNLFICCTGWAIATAWRCSVVSR